MTNMNRIGVRMLTLLLFVAVSVSCQNFFWSHRGVTEEPIVGCVEYGYLYNWYAATDARKISSSDEWDVPTLTQYRTLADYIGAEGNYTTNDVGAKLKEIGSTYWSDISGNETNEFGFNGRGAGVRYVNLNPTATWQELGVRLHLLCKNKPMETATYAVSIYQDAFWAVVGYFDEPTGGSLRLLKTSTTLSHGETGTYVGNDGKVYPTICIGTQEWVASNLAETKYRNGDPIPTVEDATTWAGLTTGAKAAYGNNYEYVGCDEEAPVNLTSSSYSFSYTPVDCSALTFPHAISSLTATSIANIYMGGSISASDVEAISIVTYESDSGLSLIHDSTELEAGGVVYYNNGVTVGGNITMVRDAAGSSSLTGSIKMIIWYSGTQTNLVTYNFTYNGCP